MTTHRFNGAICPGDILNGECQRCGKKITNTELLDSIKEFPTLRDIPEGSKFCYADSYIDSIVYIKLIQPNPRMDARYIENDKLEQLSYAVWCVIIDNNGDTNKNVRNGKLIAFNDMILVRVIEDKK